MNKKLIKLSIILLIFLIGCNRQKTAPLASNSQTETISVNGYTLLLQPTDSIALLDTTGNAEAQKVLDDIKADSNKLKEFVDKAQAAAKLKVSELRKYYTTSDSTIILYLENNKQLVFPKMFSNKDTTYSCSYLPSINYFSLTVHCGLTDIVTSLMNRKNGYMSNVTGSVYISPDKTKIFAISVNLSSPHSGNKGIQLLTLSGDTLKTEFTYYDKRWRVTDTKWLAENKLIIEREYIDDETGEGTTNKYDTLTIE